ncbi:MAG: TolC family protein, partial [Siphonobacter aquaeclarae]|nr:TolC family protein [Siphonobacter aquaeclarae]
MYRFVLFLLLLTTVPGYSQRRIPLEEAIGLALRNNTALKVSADRIQIADARFRQVKDRALPQTSASLQAARLSILSPFELNMGGPEPAFALPPTSFWSTIGMVSAGKEIFSGFAEKSAHKSAELLAEASRLDAEKDSREIEYAVVASYYNIYKLMQSARILDENRELLLRKEQDVKNMLREGILTSNELLKIQLQQSNLELSRVDVRNAQEAALFNLGTLLGVETPVAIDTTLKLTDALPDQLGDLLGQAETSRSELKANVLRIKSAESNLTQTRSVLYPHVRASAMYLY